MDAINNGTFVTHEALREFDIPKSVLVRRNISGNIKKAASLDLYLQLEC